LADEPSAAEETHGVERMLSEIDAI